MSYCIKGALPLLRVASSQTKSKIESAASYAVSFYAYQPATVASMDLNSAQSLLLGLVHSLVVGDEAYCCLLAGVCADLPQLSSKYLSLWLTEDFNFSRQDIQAALFSLTQFLVAGPLHLPHHILEIMSALAAKYGVSGLQLSSSAQEDIGVLETDIQRAVVKNSLNDIVALSERGEDINRKTESGETLVHLAVRSSSAEAIAILGYLKADLEDKNTEKLTPLHQAVLENNAPAIRALVYAGVSVTRRIQKGDSMLHLAAAKKSNRALEALIEARSEVDLRNYLDETPLVHAVKAGNLEGVEMLLKKGANCNLLARGKRPLEMAMESGNIGILKALLNARADAAMPLQSGDTVFHLAARSSNAEAVQVLINYGIPIDIMNDNGFMPLHVASDPSILRMLIAGGANVDSKTDVDKQTALHLASAQGSRELIRELIMLGASLELEDNFGNTALSIAASSSKPDIVSLLLDEGANPNSRNNRQQSPLSLTGCEECFDLMLEAGAVLNVGHVERLALAQTAVKNGQPGILRYLHQQGYDLNMRGTDNNGLLHLAVSHGKVSIVKLLLDLGLDPDMKGRHRQTPLHLAVCGGCIEIVTMLLDSGANCRAADRDGLTALHIAACRNLLDIVKLLVERDADVNAKGSNQLSVLTWATIANYPKIVDYLKSKGARK